MTVDEVHEILKPVNEIKEPYARFKNQFKNSKLSVEPASCFKKTCRSIELHDFHAH